MTTSNKKTETDGLGSLNCKFEALKTITHVLNKTKTPTPDEILNVKHWFYMLVKERLILDPFAVVDLVGDIESNVPPAVIKEPIAPLVSTDFSVILNSLLPLSRNGKRLLLIMLLKPDLHSGNKTTVYYKSFARVFSTNNAAREMKAAITEIAASSSIYSRDKSESLIRSYEVLNNGLTIHTHEYSTGHLKEIILKLLPANFLKQIARVESSHSMGLFLMLALTRGKQITYSVDEIIDAFSLPKSFLLSSNLRNKFLNPSCNHITENSSCIASFHEEKKGGRINSVSHITFSLEKKQ